MEDTRVRARKMRTQGCEGSSKKTDMLGYRDPLLKGQQDWDRGLGGEVKTVRPLLWGPRITTLGKQPRGQGLFRVRASSSLWTVPSPPHASRDLGPFRIKVPWGKCLKEEGSVWGGDRA